MTDISLTNLMQIKTN